ncbi:MAG: tRNA lysidine(34) synthetase TilS [Bryobacteraceae bacterium]
MLDRIRATIARYRMFTPGQRVGVAVSGGVDSVCLLDVLRELAPEWALRLTVLHVNHRLRGEESRADEEFVRKLAESYGLEFRLRSLDVGQLAGETADNLEQAARRVRGEFFLEFIRRGALDRIALGHTRSDQAETVLFRFLRGAGTAGLAGIRPVTAEGFVRPLLEVDRQDVLEYLRERGLPWREDSTNADPAFARNRIRHHLLPALSRDWNPDLPHVLAGVARIALDEEAYWAAEIERLTSGHFLHRPPALLFRADWLGSLPPASARRVIRRAIEETKGDLRRIDLRHVEQVLELSALVEGSRRIRIPGLEVFRSFDWVRLVPAGVDRAASRDYELPAPVPGEIPLPDGTTVLSLRVLEPGTEPLSARDSAASRYNVSDGDDLDWGRIPGPLCVRNWRPGDRYRPAGHTRETKIKLLFQGARIPLWERRGWPVISCGAQIVWARKFGVAAEYAASPGCGPVLRVSTASAGSEV